MKKWYKYRRWTSPANLKSPIKVALGALECRGEDSILRSTVSIARGFFSLLFSQDHAPWHESQLLTKCCFVTLEGVSVCQSEKPLLCVISGWGWAWSPAFLLWRHHVTYPAPSLAISALPLSEEAFAFSPGRSLPIRQLLVTSLVLKLYLAREKDEHIVPSPGDSLFPFWRLSFMKPWLSFVVYFHQAKLRIL